MKRFRCVAGAIALAFLGGAAQAQSAGEQALRAIHTRWNGNTYRTLTFVQTTEFGGTRAPETWYDSMKSPGLLRIDIAPRDSTARMILFRGDSVYQGRMGRPITARPYVHPLMVLFTDISSSDPAVTIAKVAALGFDLTRSRDDVFKGKPVTVIGAGTGDSTSSQFWVEKDRQLVVRIIEKERQAGGGISDTQVLQYARAGRGWVESEIVFYQGGKLQQREVYNDIRIDVVLDDAIFQPVLANVPAWIAARPK